MSATPTISNIARPACFFALVLLTVSCSLHEVREDRPPPLEMPDGFVRATDGAGAEGPDRWWEAFGDAGLDALVEQALSENLDIQRAWARVDQARALAARVGAGWWPQVTASAGAGRSGASVDTPAGRQSQHANQFSLSVAASYEFDLWGQLSSEEEAAKLDVKAGREDLSTAAMSVAAQVTDTWFALVETRQNRRLQAAQLALNQRYLELVELRFGVGSAAAVDVLQQRQQVAATESLLPPIRATEAVLEHQLAVLLGKAPGTLELAEHEEYPTVPALPALGVPAELLQRRPDIRAAYLRVLATDHRVGAAIASRYPTISVSGSLGFSATDIVELFEGWLYNIAASIAGVVWDGGRLGAEVDRQKAALVDTLQAYAQTTLTALQEVENALVREREQAATIDHQDRQLGIARQTLDEARFRYLSGLTDYLPVLTTLQGVQQLERSIVGSRRQLLSYRVQLCRALGGSWMGDLERPVAAESGAGSTAGAPSDAADSNASAPSGEKDE